MDRAYFAITVGEFNALDDENRRDVEALLRSIREAVKRSAKRQSLKPARKSGK
jgi:hypothetical protein